VSELRAQLDRGQREAGGSDGGDCQPGSADEEPGGGLTRSLGTRAHVSFEAARADHERRDRDDGERSREQRLDLPDAHSCRPTEHADEQRGRDAERHHLGFTARRPSAHERHQGRRVQRAREAPGSENHHAESVQAGLHAERGTEADEQQQSRRPPGRTPARQGPFGIQHVQHGKHPRTQYGAVTHGVVTAQRVSATRRRCTEPDQRCVQNAGDLAQSGARRLHRGHRGGVWSALPSRNTRRPASTFGLPAGRRPIPGLIGRSYPGSARLRWELHDPGMARPVERVRPAPSHDPPVP
jgi:hypothetical protein